MTDQLATPLCRVRLRCISGAGATPVLRTSRVGSRRAGRSRPLFNRNQHWSETSP
jgi:hypothetical protein